MKYLLTVSAILIATAILFAPTPVVAQADGGAPCCSLGDVNGSGTVSVIDIVLARRHILGIDCLDEEALCNADVDGDGLVTETDLDLMQQFILQIIPTFPRCGDLDGDGQLEWPGDDLNFFTGCFGGGGPGCENADANDNSGLATDDLFTFIDPANGSVQSFPGCACGEGACADPQ